MLHSMQRRMRKLFPSHLRQTVVRFSHSKYRAQLALAFTRIETGGIVAALDPRAEEPMFKSVSAIEVPSEQLPA